MASRAHASFVTVALLLIAMVLPPARAGAGVIVPIADDDLIAHADFIVLGQVARIESHRDDTDNLSTYITVAVDEFLKGALPEAEVTVRELGGKVGDLMAWMSVNPEFQVGERTLLFMSQHPDGSLRTHQLYFGKFTIVTDPASGDLVAVRGVPRNVTVLRRSAAGPGAAPSAVVGRELHEFAQDIRNKAGQARPLGGGRGPALPFASSTAPPSGTVESLQEFRFFDDPDPQEGLPDPNLVLKRWFEPDDNVPITVRISSPGEPLASGQGVPQIRAAMRIWSRVATTSFRFVEGPLVTDSDSSLRGFLFNGENVISFRDPLEQLQDPIGCGGTLAAATLISTSSEQVVVGGRTFNRALEADMVVNDGWDFCTGFSGGGFYQSFSNFAEVMTHELGHMLGLGHSASNTIDSTNLGGRAGATMRPVASFDGRGAALHADDRQGVTFIYPGRTLTIGKSGPGTITSDTDGIDCGSDCMAGFAVNSTVTLTATPGAGVSFAGFLEPGCALTVLMSQSRTCTAVFTPGPDLVMAAVSSPPSAPPGATITVNNTVRNDGLDAGAFTVGIYLSNSSTITTLNPRLATRSLIGGLAFNATSTDAAEVTIPGNVPPGTYFIGAIADSDDEVGEGTLEGNNALAAAQIVIARPDLVVTALTAPATAGTGLTISASATVSNPAPANIPAPASTLAFYLSTDATRDGGDRRLGETRLVPLLARNASSAGTTVLTIPADLEPGTYFLIAYADDLNVVDEDDEENNTRATATAITIRRPDLAVTSVTAPAVAAAGMNVSVTHIVRNLAVAPGNAAASTSRLVLSSDNAFGGDVDLGTVAIPVLAAATQFSATRTVQIPGNTSAGLYWIFARANALETVIETDTPPAGTQANNALGTLSPIVVGPDLLMTAATSAPTATAPGLVVNVTNTVRNQGGAAAGPFAVGIYLSRNTSFDGSAVLVGTRQVATSLAPAATSMAVTPVTIPASSPAGTHYLIVRADDGLAIAEANETNNLLTTVAIQVVKADLKVMSVTATPAAVVAGTNVSVTHVVRNVALASGGAPASVSRLFLSSDTTLDVGDVQLGADVPVGALAGMTQLSLMRSVQIPIGTAPGLYWIFARANATGAVQEDPAAQGNNELSTPTPILVGPDLVVSAATATPAATAPGLTVTVANTVRNAGAQAAGAFDVAVYLSSDGVYQDGVDLLLATRRVGAGLAPGAISAAMTPVVIPTSQPAGSHSLIVRADVTGAAPNEVTEGNENNNLMVVALNVVRADLTVTALTAPAAAAPGMNVSVSHTVRNGALAPGGAPATVTRLFLSPTSATNPIDAAATPLLDVPVGPQAGGASVTVVRSVQVPGVAPGRYWIIADANATDTVIEADAMNNTRVAPILIGPDLVPTAVTIAPVSTAPGQTVNVASTVRNQGGQTAAPFQVGFVLSENSAFDPGTDIPLGSRQVAAGLAPLAMSSATTPLMVPGNLSAGAYFILVLADAAGDSVEADESNNLQAIPLTLVRPDLTVPSVTATPATLTAGANVSVTHVVRNAAAAAGVAGPTTSRLYLSSDTSLDGADVALLDVPVATLAGQAQASLVRSVRIPLGTAPGLYWIIAEANATGAVLESLPGNNSGRTLTPIVVGPDLVVSAATATPTASAPGLTVSVSSTVRNQGGQAAGPFTIGIYLSTDSVFDGGDALLASRTVAAGLAPGAMSAGMTPVVLLGNLSSATHVLFVQVDIVGAAPGEVAEADETNNLRAIPLSVVRPNLTVLSITAPATAAAGANVSVTHVVRNLALAAGAAPATVSRLFLSTDNALDGADVQLGGDVPVGALAGMAQASLTRSVQIPPGTPPGLYFLFAQADAPGTVVESDEANNALSRPILVGPDVTLTAVSTVAGTIPGATINVVYTLRNLGGAPAGPFNVGFTLVPATPPGADIPMGPTRTAVVLAAGGTLVSSTPVVVPASATQGQYRVRVSTDVGAVVTEITEANNDTVTGIVNITPPDLFMAGLVVPSVGVAGRTIGIQNTVINTATAPGTAPAVQVGLYLSADIDIQPGADTLLATRAIATLGPSVTSTATTPVALPTTPGSYFIGAIADRNGVVIESNEGNNIQSSAIAVVPEMIRNRTATASVTTANCILPVNNATLGLTGTLTISTHTGTSWSGTVRLPNNTATLTGTIDTGGSISGSFTIVNAGGARGGGSFSGSAGSGPSGGFSATFTGGFTSGEVCTINASVSAP